MSSATIRVIKTVVWVAALEKLVIDSVKPVFLKTSIKKKSLLSMKLIWNQYLSEVDSPSLCFYHYSIFLSQPS